MDIISEEIEKIVTNIISVTNKLGLSLNAPFVAQMVGAQIFLNTASTEMVDDEVKNKVMQATIRSFATKGYADVVKVLNKFPPISSPSVPTPSLN